MLRVFRMLMVGLLVAPAWLGAAGASQPPEDPPRMDYFGHQRGDSLVVGAESYEVPGTSVEEFCLDRGRLVCAGPYDTRKIVDRVEGPVQANVTWNETWVNGTWDMGRYYEHGPYAFDMPVGDDLRVCHFDCQIPYVANATVNTTVSARVDVILVGEFHREVPLVLNTTEEWERRTGPLGIRPMPYP